MGPYRKEFRILPRKTMRIRFGDPIDLSDLAGRELDGDTLAAASARLMDAITAMEAEVRGEEAPATRMVFRRDTAALEDGPTEGDAA